MYTYTWTNDGMTITFTSNVPLMPGAGVVAAVEAVPEGGGGPGNPVTPA